MHIRNYITPKSKELIVTRRQTIDSQWVWVNVQICLSKIYYRRRLRYGLNKEEAKEKKRPPSLLILAHVAMINANAKLWQILKRNTHTHTKSHKKIAFGDCIFKYLQSDITRQCDIIIWLFLSFAYPFMGYTKFVLLLFILWLGCAESSASIKKAQLFI